MKHFWTVPLFYAHLFYSETFARVEIGRYRSFKLLCEKQKWKSHEANNNQIKFFAVEQ